MNKALLWIGSLGILAGLTTVALVAKADVKHRCDMTGTWLDSGENWVFSADYLLTENGTDSLWGRFANPRAGAAADISGAAHSGIWNIKFTYTDNAHPGWVRYLVGTGTFNRGSHNIVVNGRDTLRKGGAEAGNGSFRMTGKCSAI